AEAEHPERQYRECTEHQRHVAVFVAGDRAVVIPPIGWSVRAGFGVVGVVGLFVRGMVDAVMAAKGFSR
ncbi:hypothetical protein QV65_32365, partial [Rhodococcus erythropolis]